MRAQTAEIKDSILSGFPEVLKRPMTLLRAGAVGWFVGVLPAIGTGVAGIASYFVEKKYSKEGPNFGKGAPAGLIAAEVGKGACVVGDLIPTFSLGIPGSVTGAILLAALIIHGVEPGPRFLLSGSLPHTIFAGMILSQASFLVSGLLMGRFFMRIVYWPNIILGPTICVLIFLGSFAERNSSFDVFIALVFGVFGYALDKIKYPSVCMVLGLILGRLVEGNFHRSLSISLDSYSIFFTRPITLIMLSITALFLVGPFAWYYLRKFFGKGSDTQETAVQEAEKATGGEVALLAALAFIFGAFIVTARQYDSYVRLFPWLICSAGLIFVVWRFLVIAGHVTIGDSSWIRKGVLFRGSTSWQWSVITITAYFAAMYLVGFVAASFFYVTAVILLSDRSKRKQALLTGAVVAVSIYFLAKLVHLELPLGLFELLQ